MGIVQIIQGYISDDKPLPNDQLASLSSYSFFGDEAILFAHRAAYYALWGVVGEL